MWANATSVTMPNTNVYVDAVDDPSLPAPVPQTLTLGMGFSCKNFIFYRGTLNLNAQTITTTEDFVVFGAGYNPVDLDWPPNTNTRFDYYDARRLLFYDPDTHRTQPPASPPAPITAAASYVYSASFADLAGAHIEAGENFYVNGAHMETTGTTWGLKVPPTAGNQPVFNGGDAATGAMWGTPYAVAFNMKVRNSDALSGGWIVAVEPIWMSSPPTPIPFPPGTPDEYNNYVDVDDYSSSHHWQSGRPEIISVEAIFDNLLKIVMGKRERDSSGNFILNSMLIENSSDEIYKAITQDSIPVYELLTTHNDGSTSQVDGQPKRLFRDVFIEAPSGHSAAAKPFPENLIRPSSLSGTSFTSPIDYRDTDTFYLLTTVHGAPTPLPATLTASTPAHPRSVDYQPHTWRTDAVGSDTVSGQQSAKAYSTDSKGHNEKTIGYSAIAGTEKPGNPNIGGVAYFGTTIPNISMPKGRLSAAQGGTLSIAYDANMSKLTSPIDTTDNMAPVLHTIKVGRASHDKPSTQPYDAHNFFELRYSEPVDIGSDARFSIATPTAGNVQAQTSFTSAPDYGGGISASGSSGSDVTVAGYFSYEGQPVKFYDFNSTTPKVVELSPDRNSPGGGKTYDSLYRPDAWRLRVFLSGLSEQKPSTNPSSDTYIWKGWHTGIPEPVTNPPPPADTYVTPVLTRSPVTLTPNANIKDKAATPNNFSSAIGTNEFSPFDPADAHELFRSASDASAVARFTGRWDVDPPAFSFTELPDNTLPFVPGTHSAECEIIPVSIDGGLTVAKLDFFIQDNSRENDFADANTSPLGTGVYEWAPFAGLPPPQMHPDERSPQPRGVRDSTLWAQPKYQEAFKIGATSSGPSRMSDFNNNFFSEVTHRYFLEGLAYSPNPEVNDSYFSLHLIANPWKSDDSFVLEYDHKLALITDLAGNLLPSAGTTTTLPLPAVDQIAPKVQISLAPVGENKLYLQFSEGLYHNFGNLRAALSASDFSLITPGSVSIDTSKPIKVLQTSKTASPIAGVVKAVLSLNGTLTAQDVLTGFIEFNSLVCDYRGNALAPQKHVLSDIALGIVQPLWASDGYRFDEKQDLGDSVSTLKTSEEFTGKGRLHPSDIIMETGIKTPFINAPFTFNPDTAPLILYYDVDPKGFLGADEVFLNMWLPLGAEGIVSRANTEARSVNAYAANGNLRDFMIPEADPENIGGSRMEFLYLLEAPDPTNSGSVRLIPAARYEPVAAYDEFATDPGNTRPPFVIFPWSFQITAPIVQRGGVSIYNNVINPNRGDKALLTYTLRKGGMVNVNIFSLDGSLVYAVHRGTQAAGTYNYYWNGKNMGGRPVARGIYFIRVLGPDVDEIRKVMVVK
jgi:hypothetical protein